jgi:hypothetical protein
MLSNFSDGLSSGYETFGVDDNQRYCNFSELLFINIKQVDFCYTSLQSTSFNVHSANRTFAYAHFPKLKTLQLDATNVFTISNFTSGNFYSATQMFANCEFLSLEQLDLHGARFAATNLSSNNGNIVTANGTFINCSIPNIQVLNLNDVIFCSPNMTSNGNITTAG